MFPSGVVHYSGGSISGVAVVWGAFSRVVLGAVSRVVLGAVTGVVVVLGAVSRVVVLGTTAGRAVLVSGAAINQCVVKCRLVN